MSTTGRWSSILVACYPLNRAVESRRGTWSRVLRRWCAQSRPPSCLLCVVNGYTCFSSIPFFHISSTPFELLWVVDVETTDQYPRYSLVYLDKRTCSWWKWCNKLSTLIQSVSLASKSLPSSRRLIALYHLFQLYRRHRYASIFSTPLLHPNFFSNQNNSFYLWHPGRLGICPSLSDESCCPGWSGNVQTLYCHVLRSKKFERLGSENQKTI